MSVSVKLKNLTTDIIQMGFNHVVSLIQVPWHLKVQKWVPGGIHVCRKMSKIAYFMAFFVIHVTHQEPSFGLLSVTRDLNKWYNMIKTHLNNIFSQIFEFYPD